MNIICIILWANCLFKTVAHSFLSLWSFPSQSLGAQKEYKNLVCFLKVSTKLLHMGRKYISMTSFTVKNISKLIFESYTCLKFFLVDE